MQLPGMSTDPVRLDLSVTWWPPQDDFSLSRRLWTRPTSNDVWQLEDMATSASPIRYVELPSRWRDAERAAMTVFSQIVERDMEPFR